MCALGGVYCGSNGRDGGGPGLQWDLPLGIAAIVIGFVYIR